jgi:hypothetical protein
MTAILERNELGQITKRTVIAEEEPAVAEEPTVAEADQAPPIGDPLDPYRSQARDLAEALGKVKAIHEQNAAVTQQRDAISQHRQSLLDSWVKSENEASVEELAKVGSRVEMFDAKIANLAVRLSGAEAKLKAALATFSVSFHSLFMTLRTYLINAAAEQIRLMLHPSVRVISGTSIAEIAGMAEPVVNIAPLAINPEPGSTMHNNTLPPENIQRAAERSLPKVDALLTEAAKHPDFVPPPPFSLETWRASVSPGVPVAA